jgi:hypothetical protein
LGVVFVGEEHPVIVFLSHSRYGKQGYDGSEDLLFHFCLIDYVAKILFLFLHCEKAF